MKYNQLKDQISKVELDLRKLSDPLQIHLPRKKELSTETRTEQIANPKTNKQ